MIPDRAPQTARTLPIELVQKAVSFALRRGWDVTGILHEAGIPPLLLTDGRARVTEAQGVSVVRTLWQLTDDEVFGMGSAPLPLGTFRLLCYGVIGARDLETALIRGGQFTRVVPALPVIALESDEEHARLSFDPGRVADDPEHLVVFAGLAVMHRLMAWVIGRSLDLVRVELPFDEPSSREIPRLILGVPQVYGAPTAALVFNATWLRSPLMRSEAELDDFLASSPAGLLARPVAEHTVAQQVHRIIGQSIGSQIPDGSQIAARLGISPQTLRRHLAAEETSLSTIRDEVLRDAAVTSLVQGSERLADLAARLGFSEPSAFTRAFTRWTGSPPSVYRDARDPADRSTGI